METNLGDVYFDTRARLGSAIHALIKLGGDVELHPAKVSLLESLLSNLKEPFLFVVTGEVNVGKSTLLNAVFGEEFCQVGVIPTTARIHLFKYGEEHRNHPVSDTLEELYRPNLFLKDFNIVDTPGTNSIEDDHQEITERFIPMADLVVFTFSASNPWAASAWALLKQIHEGWYKNIVFALNQCDLREAEEIEAIVEHLKITAQQKLGAQFPIFTISGKQAFQAKTSGLKNEGLWNESGFESFENHISETVNSSAIREGKLGNLSRSARVVLKEIQEQLAAGARILKADEKLLSGLGTSIGQQRARTVDKFNAFLRGLDGDYMELSIAGTEKLEQRLGVGASLARFFGREQTPDEIEKDVIAGMSGAAITQVNDATNIVEDDLNHLWTEMADKMQEHFSFRLRVGSDSGVPEWGAQRDHMRGRLVETVEKQLGNMELAKLLRGRMVARRWLGAVFILGALLALGGGVAAFVMDFVPSESLAVFIAVVAGVVIAAAIFGGIHANQTRQALVSRLGTHFEERRSDLGLALRTALNEEVSGFFEDFNQLFAPLHQLCDEHRERYAPQVEQLNKVVAAFQEVDSLIGLEPLEDDLSETV